MTKLGIASLSFNGLQYTKELIASIKESKINEAFTFVFIDNGSTDGTIEYINGLNTHSDIHPKCKLVARQFNTENRGCAAGWNQGIAQCFGLGCEYVIEVNNDIKFHPDCIQMMFDMIEKYKEYEFITATHYGDEYLTAELKEEAWQGLCWSCFLISKKAWEICGKFDENIWPVKSEDYDYHGRLMNLGVGWAGFKNCSVYHVGDGSGKANTEKGIDWAGHLAKNHEYVLKKGNLIREGKLHWNPKDDQEKLAEFAPPKNYMKL